MNPRHFLFLAIAGIAASVSCSDKHSDTQYDNANAAILAVLTERAPFYKTDPLASTSTAYTVGTDTIGLTFFGWNESDDHSFTLDFPEGKTWSHIILDYTMTGLHNGPSAWDNTTMVFVKNKLDGQWYEIARAVTPYGGSFKSTWHKHFYIDVTEYAPMLSGETEFRLYYGGFDASDSRQHAVKLDFSMYEGTPEKNVVHTAKVYDSSASGNTGYRGWAYGVAGYDIEDDARLGLRTFTLPTDVKSLAMKVSITGHGHDQGIFTERTGYTTANAAEFDENTYTVKINDVTQLITGKIFYNNSTNYSQAGTYYYDRANWAPGNPINVQWWTVTRPKGDTFTLDIDLEKFVSENTQPNAEGVAQYIVEVDLFGYDK